MTFAHMLELARAGTPVFSHSGQVEPGGIFVALPSLRGSADGAAYVAQALERGAAYVLAAPGVDLPANASATLVTVEDVRESLGQLARAMYGTDKGPAVIGVTGTNGKTTVAYLLERLFIAAGRKVGVLGTISYRWPGREIPAPLTTPDCLTVHKLLAGMRGAGAELAIMEVSSHALDQGRVAGLDFAAAVLTNLTQDHLDYHGDMETYFAAKAKLFTQLPMADKAKVINAQDPYGQRLLGLLDNAVGYGVDLPEDTAPGRLVVNGRVAESSAAGQVVEASCGGQRFTLRTPLVGRHNVMNLLAACGAGLQLGLSAKDMAGLNGCAGAPGRLEPVPNAQGLNVFVDYAHTPDALENVLSALGRLNAQRVIAVFGCGGDRDRTKRPLMARAVCRHAHVAVLTSDNPRTEDPARIIEDTKAGLADCAEAIVEPDRKAAIAAALHMATPQDVVVIAGKGHEDYQIIGTEKLPFSDVAVVREVLQCA